ncbi:MAG: putative AlkP superfamily phosphohydrolase/phosphomutase/tetratricopeptide (TPR) repeat protein [Crocinitomicaceae bacterium]|jgi:predicted AlkP superfamily phosphohydrolase/phosphomutase/tetratricopeptide (TPR) repeat protein
MKKVILIGWDAADWEIIDPLLAEGKLPALAGLIKDGVRGNMSTMNPPYSPMLWTSVATGKTPDKHGVLGFIEIDTENQLVRPVTVAQRKVKALWNIFHNQGMKSNLIGWWPSHPAEPINGTVVSDLFPKPTATFDKPWPLAKDSVHPKSLNNEIKDLRVHPQELTAAHIFPFIPKAAEIEEKDEKSLSVLSKILAHNTSVHAASTWAMENTDWGFTAVYYDMIDHFCHAFINFHPPRIPAIPEKQFDIYKEAVTGAYLYQDMMLERTLELAGEDALVIVMSDHGYVSDNNRVLVKPDIHAAPALEHREFGMFVMKGPGVKKGETIYGTSLLDIAPTLLNYYDLPIGKDMDGSVITDAFDTLPKTKTIESWETQPGDFAELNKDVSIDPLSQQEAMEQLIELGYIDRPDTNIEKAIHETKCDLRFNLARVYMGKQEYPECEKVLVELMKEDVNTVPYLVDLVHISIIQKKYKEARIYLEDLRQKDPKAAVRTRLAEAKILMGEGMVEKAKKILEELNQRPVMKGITYFELGKMHLKLQEFEKALVHFEKAAADKPNHAKYRHALSSVLLKLDRPEEALDHALTAIELVRNFPDAHYTIGQALEKMGDLENAKQAFAVAEKLRPSMTRAAIAHENIIQKQSTVKDTTDTSKFPEITIVSGLPRSGTSMMMQMLHAGGIPPLTDGKRKEDESNPKGYFEFEKTKSLHKDNSWMGEAEDKVIKVVAQMLKFLPKEYRYKVVFMTRNIDEVLASQNVMLKRDKLTAKEGVRKSFEAELKKLDALLDNEPGIEVLKVAYADVIESPKEEALKIELFLGKELDIKKMVDQVEAGLYRNRVLKF